MAVGQYETVLRIDNETRRLTRRIPLCVECPGTVDAYRHYARGDALQRLGPCCIFSGTCREAREQHCECRQYSAVCHHFPD